MGKTIEIGKPKVNKVGIIARGGGEAESITIIDYTGTLTPKVIIQKIAEGLEVGSGRKGLKRGEYKKKGKRGRKPGYKMTEEHKQKIKESLQKKRRGRPPKVKKKGRGRPKLSEYEKEKRRREKAGKLPKNGVY